MVGFLDQCLLMVKGEGNQSRHWLCSRLENIFLLVSLKQYSCSSELNLVVFSAIGWSKKKESVLDLHFSEFYIILQICTWSSILIMWRCKDMYVLVRLVWKVVLHLLLKKRNISTGAFVVSLSISLFTFKKSLVENASKCFSLVM